MAGLDNFRQKMLELAEQTTEAKPDLPEDTAEPDNPTR